MAENKPDPFTGLDKMLLNPKKQQVPTAIAQSEPQAEEPKKERSKATTQASKKDRYHDSNLSSNHDSTIDDIRKAIRVRGNEQSIHRLSREEKRALKDLVYAYDKDGVRTSENEMTRIALNWLITDHKERGKDSVLAQVLSSMND